MPRDHSAFDEFLKRLGRDEKLRTGFAVGIGIAALRALTRQPLSNEEKMERRAQENQRVLREAAERAESQRQTRLRSRHLDLFWTYFHSGPGRDQMDCLGKIIVGPLAPFPDAKLVRRNGGFRQTAWRITSDIEKLQLQASFDSADRDGSLFLLRDGKRIWSLGIYALAPVMLAHDKQPIDEVNAKLAAKLLSVFDSGFDRIAFMRPDYENIRRQLWIEFMRANPDIAMELEWSEAAPLP